MSTSKKIPDSLGFVHIGFDKKEYPTYEAELRKLIDSVKEAGTDLIFMDVPTTSPQSEAERILMMQVAACRVLQAFAIVSCDEAQSYAEYGSDHITQESIDEWEKTHTHSSLIESYNDASLASRIYR